MANTKNRSKESSSKRKKAPVEEHEENDAQNEKKKRKEAPAYEISTFDMLCSDIAKGIQETGLAKESISEDLVFLAVCARMYQHMTGTLVRKAADMFAIEASSAPAYVSQAVTKDELTVVDLDTAIAEKEKREKKIKEERNKKSKEKEGKKSEGKKSEGKKKRKRTSTKDKSRAPRLTLKMYTTTFFYNFPNVPFPIKCGDRPYYDWNEIVRTEIEDVRGRSAK